MTSKSNTNQALWLSLGSLSAFGLAMISAAFFSRYFSKEEYGTYRQVLFVYQSLLVVFSAGLPKVISYYLPKYPIEEGKTIVRKLTTLLLILGLIFSLFLFFSSGIIAYLLNNPRLEIGLKWFSPIPLLVLPTLGLQELFSTYRKTEYYAMFSTISRAIMLIFIVVLVLWLGSYFLNAIYGWLVGSLFVLFMALYFKSIPFKGIISRKRTDLSNREILNYSLPLVLASLASIAMKSADQFYISRFFGPEEYANYANGAIQIPFVAMITSATSVVLMPIFAKLANNKSVNDSFQELITVWRTAILKSATIIYPIVGFVLLNSEAIVRLLFGELYSESVNYFRVVIILNVFNIIVFAPLLLSLGRSKYYSFIQIIGAVLVWIGGGIIVLFFEDPLLVVVWSTIVNIILVYLGLRKSLRILGVGFLEMLPIKGITIIVLHLILLSMFYLLFLHFIPSELNKVLILLLEALVFFLSVFFSGRLFSIDYLNVFRPLISRVVKRK